MNRHIPISPSPHAGNHVTHVGQVHEPALHERDLHERVDQSLFWVIIMFTVILISGCLFDKKTNDVKYNYNIELDNTHTDVDIDSVHVTVYANGDIILDKTYPGASIQGSNLPVVFITDGGALIEVQFLVYSRDVVLASDSHGFSSDIPDADKKTTVEVAVDTAKLDTIKAKDGNAPPVFITTTTHMPDTVYTGVIFTDTLDARDQDGHTLAYTLLDSATGVSINGNILTWDPAAADTGSQTISILATDGFGGFDTLTWSTVVWDAQFFLGFSPAVINAPIQGSFSAALAVRNVTDLFGFTCEIVFKSSFWHIASDSIIKGSFLGSDVVTLFHVNGDTLSIGITRKKGAAGVSGSGVLATINIGTDWGVDDSLVILNDVSLIKNDGSSVNNIDSLYIGTGVIDVE